jgi:hypothetical protein
MTFACGSVAIDNLPPGDPVDFVITLDREMPAGPYDVSLLKSPELTKSDIAAEVTDQTTSSVTVRIVAMSAFAGQAVLQVLCYRDPTATPS